MHRVDYPYWDGSSSYIVKDSLTGLGTHGLNTSGPSTIISPDGLPLSLSWQDYIYPSTPPSYVIRGFTARHQEYSEYFNYPGKPRADSLVRGLTYDSLGRVTFEYRISGTGSLRYRYLYDNVGRLLAVYSGTGAACTPTADTIVGNKYASCPATTLVDSVSYDSAGNMRKSGDAYTAGNRVTSWPTSSGTITYTYDADGNVATRHHGSVTDTLFWSATNQLDSLHSGGLSVWYEYNSFGQLVRRRHNGTIDRFFLWDRTHLIAELNASSGRRAQYIYRDGIDQPVAVATDSGGTSVIRNLVQDVYGNVIGITRDTAFVRYMSYLPWGLSDSATTSGLLRMADTNRLAWKGLMYEGDSTKLYYMRSRWYDPQARRFLSEDPIGIAGGPTLYTFGGNDPVNHWDPSGTCAYLQTPRYSDGTSGPSSTNYVGVGQEIIDSHQGARWCGCDGSTWVSSPTDIAYCHGSSSSPAITASNGGGAITMIGPAQPPPSAPAPGIKAVACQALQHWSIPGGGYTGSAVSFFVGYGVTGGVGLVSDNGGPGIYVRGGIGLGLQASAGLESGGVVGSVQGVALEAEGVGFTRSVSGSIGLSGATLSTGQAVGGLPIMGHGAATFTQVWHLSDLCN